MPTPIPSQQKPIGATTPSLAGIITLAVVIIASPAPPKTSSRARIVGVAHRHAATLAALAQLAATTPTPSEAKKARQEATGAIITGSIR